MTQYRKKPVVIEAWRNDGSMMPDWVANACNGGERIKGAGSLFIATLEGVMEARPGDWIIRGVKGELYPCKPDIFEATYEPVSAAPSLDGEEVERVKAAIDAVAYVSGQDAKGNEVPAAIWNAEEVARAAIAAMRPTLSEEDKARVEEIRKRIVAIRDAMLNRRGPTLGDLANAEQALSLIDKLAGEG